MRALVSTLGSALRWIGDRLSGLVADSPASRRPPGGNYIPNSNGEGGRVISSGDSGAQ